MDQFVTTRDLHRKPKEIMDRVLLGQKIIVMKYSKPIATINPYETTEKKKYTKADFIKASHAQVVDGDKTLSQTFKQYIY